MYVFLSLLAGLFVWTFLEYALHAWAGHKPKGRTEPSREHLRHHAKPDYFTSLPKKLLLAVPVLSGAFLLSAPVLGVANAAGFVGGIAIGWRTYEFVHRDLHVHAPRSFYGRWARRHHFHHHFSRPFMNHGVTTPLWDFVFRTYERPEVVRVPRRHAPKLPWLLEGDQIAAPLARDFVLT